MVAFLFFYYTDRTQSAAHTLGWLRGGRGTGEARTWNEYLLVSTAALLWLPMLYAALFSRRELSDYGFARGDVKTGWMWAALIYAAMLVPLFLAAGRPEFQRYYPLQPRAETDTAYLIYFELTYGFYLFCWEFFFRGFLTFGLFRWLGWWGVLVQSGAFMLLHAGKPPPELFGSFIAGGVLAVIALRSKSFLPAFWAHWGIAVTFDMLIIFGRR